MGEGRSREKGPGLKTVWARPEAFADTSFHFAVADEDARQHEVCADLLQQVVERSGSILTTNLIVAETHALMLSRLGRRAALDWLRGIEDAAIIVRVTEPDEVSAMEILTRYDDKDFSFTDAVSFSVMETHGVTIAFSLDSHFQQYGRFIVLPLSGDRLPGL